MCVCVCVCVCAGARAVTHDARPSASDEPDVREVRERGDDGTLEWGATLMRVEWLPARCQPGSGRSPTLPTPSPQPRTPVGSAQHRPAAPRARPVVRIAPWRRRVSGVGWVCICVYIYARALHMFSGGGAARRSGRVESSARGGWGGSTFCALPDPVRVTAYGSLAGGRCGPESLRVVTLTVRPLLGVTSRSISSSTSADSGVWTPAAPAGIQAQTAEQGAEGFIVFFSTLR